MPWFAALTPALLLPITGNAQAGWLDGSAVWTETYAYFDGSLLHHAAFDIHLDGDTAIGGQLYHRLRRQGTDTLWAIGGSEPTAILPLDQYLGALREDLALDRWWVVFSGFLNEELLYDFDLSEGQALSGTYGDCSENYIVGPVDSVQIGGSWRKRFHFSPWDRYIIAGVGMSSGLFGHLCPFLEEFGCLLTFTFEGDPLVVDGCASLALSAPGKTADELFEPYPNPVVDRCMLGAVHAGRSIMVRDGTGRILERLTVGPDGGIDMSAWPSGTYLLQLGRGHQRIIKW